MKARALLLLFLATCAPPPAVSDVTITTIDFGAVEPNHPHHRLLRVTNLGGAARLLRIERESGPDVFTVTPTQVGFAPRETASWNVTLSSSEPGEVEARFVAIFEGGRTPFIVRALVAPPCEVESLDLRDARLGTINTRVITVTNPRAEPAELYLGSPPGPFAVTPSGTLRLSPGESREVTISFAPTTPGSFEASWLRAPRTDCTATTSTLSGRGVAVPLAFIPGRLNFSAVPVGSEVTRTVDLQNFTREALQLTSATLASPAFTLLTPMPLGVPAEGRATLVVRASPPSSEQHAASLVFQTNIATQPELVLPLLVNRARPCISTSPERIDFGTLEAGCQGPEQLITFTNDCPHSVRLGAPRAPGGFGLISAVGTGLLPPGAQRRVAVRAAPSNAGTSTGSLELDADVLDGTEPVRVELVALASAAPRVEEVHVMPGAPQVDVLFVLDDSPRMRPLAASVNLNLGFFARYAEANGYDTRVAVMTTSMAPEASGRLRRGPTGAAWLDSPTPEALSAHGAVRGEATGRSSCLEALQAAFTSPLRDDPAELGGFLRPGTPLRVICITNGRDEVRAPVSEVLAALERTLPVKRDVAVVARFETSTCEGEVDPGPLRAMTLGLSFGVMEDICTPNWVAALERFGVTHHGVASVPVLGPVAPERGPLQVFFDGVELPEFSWTWKPQGRFIEFSPGVWPPPATRVTVRYTPACVR